MKGLFKRVLSVLLAMMMVISVVPISVQAHASAASLGYVVGDIIEFGSYPQSEVTDSALIAELESQMLNWISYGYYSGSGEFGSMAESDYMKYADVEYGGEKYRAVTFGQYRPNLTYHSSSAKNSNQDDNGYQTDIVYWFKYEPLQWRIIDPAEGIVMSENLVDSQAYAETVYCYDNGDGINTDDYYLDSTHKTYANDYAEGSLREWLNNEFYNTAFSAEEKEKVLTYKSDNSASNSEYDSSLTRDYVFIPSYDDVTNADFGFSSDADRTALGTDYAKAQGLYVPESGENSFWWLRTPGIYSYYACRVSNTGEAGAEGNSVDFCNYGVRPALRYDFDGMGERYTATFMVDGEVYDEKSYAVGETVAEPAAPEKEGYTFAGWDSAIPETMRYENLVFNAIWNAISTAVYFMDSEGNQIDCVTGSYGSSINAIDTNKTGYMFEGWYYSDGTPVQFPVTLGTEDIYVYAHYSIVLYTVNFDANGGKFSDGLTKKSTENSYGSTITLPDAPTRIGYTFVGWNEPATMPAQTLTLTAKWQVNTYDAVFDANGGIFSDGSTQKEIKADFGAEIIAPENPTRENYIFVGWEPIVGTMDTEGKTFIAEWEYSVYKLTYLDSDGNVFAEYDVSYGSELPTPDESPSKEYYVFIGWQDLPVTMPAEDIEINPIFERVSVNLCPGEGSETVIDYENMAITGVPEGVTETELQNALLVEGDGYIEISLAESGKIGTGTVVSLYDNVTGDNLGDFTVVVSGDLDGDGVRTGTDGKMINDESLMLTNWSSGTIYDSEKGEMISNPEYNLYRFLAADANEDGRVDSIDFRANGFRMYTVDKYVVNTDGDNFELDTEFSHVGYGVEGETVSYTPDEAPEGFYIDTANSVLSGTFGEDDLEFAVYYAREQYTFTAYLDGAVYIQNDYYYGQEIVNPEEPSKVGHTFVAWTPEIPTTMPASDVEIYSAFEINKHTLIFEAGDGEFADGTGAEIYEDIPYGTAIIVPENPTKIGYVFSGWGAIVPETMPDEDLTFFAEWSPATDTPYTVDIYMMDTSGIYNLHETRSYSGTTDTTAIFEAEELEGFYIDEENSVLSGNIAPDGTLVLKAYYVRNTYTVTFNVDSAPVAEIQYYYGSTLVEYQSPEKEYYVFAGWADESGNPAVFPQFVSSDLTFEATWERVKVMLVPANDICTTVIDRNGLTVDNYVDGESAWYVYGLATGVNETKLLDNYVSVQGDGYAETVVYNPQYANKTGTGTIINVYDNVTSEIVESFRIIVFGDVNGDSSVNSTDYSVISNEAAEVTNWSDKTSESYKPYMMKAADIDGSGAVDYIDAAIVSLHVLGILRVTQNTNGYDTGYDAFAVYYFTDEPLCNYNSYGSYAAGETITLPEAPTKDGYIFKGWYDYETGEPLSETMPERNIFAYAKWKEIPTGLTVTFDANGGAWSDGDTTKVVPAEYGAEVDAPVGSYGFSEDPTREAYIFRGWQDENGNNVSMPITMPDENLTLYALWENDLNFCRVKNFVRNGNETYKEMNALYEITLYSGCEKIEILENKSEEYTSKAIFDRNAEFVSDDLSQIGVVSIKAYDEESGEEITDISSYNGFYYEVWTVVASFAEGEHKVRANIDGTDEAWEEIDFAYDYCVTYDYINFDLQLDANGGYFPENATNHIIVPNMCYGESIEEYYEEPVREGYIFTGWADENGNTVAINGTMPDVDGTVYAQWISEGYSNAVNLGIHTEILRKVDNEWVSTCKVLTGEEVMARVYIDTDYFAGSGELLLYFNNDIFESTCDAGQQVLSINPYYQSYGMEGYYLTGTGSAAETLSDKMVSDGAITQEFTNAHDAVRIVYSIGETCQEFDNYTWFCEIPLKFKENATGMGGLFAVESTTCSPQYPYGAINIPKGVEYGTDSTTVAMHLWTANLNYTYMPVDSNIVSITFDSTYGEFAGGLKTQYFEGEPGDFFELGEPDGGTLYDFVGWSLDGTTVVDEIKFLNEDTTYYAVWTEKAASEVSTLSLLSTNSIFSLARSTFLVAESATLNLTDAVLSLEYTEAYYLGEALTPVVYLQYGDELFDAKKELTITYSDNNKVGTAKVLLEGLNRFSGSVALEFTISYEDIPEQIVNVVAIGEIDKISLSWGISNEVNTKTYNIYRREDGSDEYSLIKTVSGRDNLSYTDTNVEKGKKYIYYVTGVGLYGAESVPSAEVYATVQSDMQAPAIIKLSPASNSTIYANTTFSTVADDNIGAVKAVYSYSADEGLTWVEIGESTASNFTLKFDTTVLAVASVMVKVIVYDAEGNASEPVINTYKVDNYGPEKVSGISAKVQSSIITLSWNAVSDTDASYFILQQKLNGNWTTIQTNLKTRGANVENLQAETEYTFRVACVDTRGNIGEYSDEISVSTAEDTTIPAITAQSPSPSRFKNAFTYSATAQDDCGIAEIRIQVSSDEATWTDISKKTYANASKTQTYSYTINTDEYSEGNIYVRAIATDISGNESISGEIAPCREYYIDRTAPAAPTSVKATGADGYINITWTVGTEEDLGGYYVYRSTSSDGEYTAVMSNGATSNYPDQSVERGKEYFYKVRVKDSCGNMSDFSEAVSAKMLDDTIKPVINSIGATYNNTLSRNHNKFNVVATDNNVLSYMVVEYCTTKNMTYAEAARAENIADTHKNLAVRIPMDGLESGDKVYVRAYAVDIMGLRSDYVNAQYTVDVTSPSTSEYKAVISGDKVTLTWKDCGENDLAGFRIYRSENGKDYTSIGSRSVKSAGTYTFSDTVSSSESKNFYYKIEAIDNYENVSSFIQTIEYLIASEDGINTAPVAEISCKSYMILNVEDEFDASASTDDTEIVEYLWDFGDGTTSTEIKPVKKYNAVGSYTVTLTVKDSEGLQHSVTKTVEVKEREKLGTLNVRVVDENGNSMAYVPVHFKMYSSDRTVINTDSSGIASMVMAEGTYCVGTMAMKIGETNYLTSKKTVVVLPNATRTVTVTMVEGDIVTGEFEIKRLNTIEEIEAAGIDPYAPDNSYVTEATFRLTYGSTSVKVNYINNSSNVLKYTVTDDDGNDTNKTIPASGGGRKIVGITYLGNDTVAILDIPAQAQYLKEMFDVRLHITNNASTDFVLKQSEVVLNLPQSGGLSLLTDVSDEYNKSLSVQLEPIRGQSTVTVSWMLRGEIAGEYDLTADFSGVFEEYGEDGWINTTFKTEEPVKVYGLEGVTLRMLAADEIHNDTLYFNVELENERDIDLLLPDISVINDKVMNVTDRVLGVDGTIFNSTAYLLNIYVQLENGEKQYLPIVYGENGNLTANLEVLAPGQKLVHEYVAYNAVNYDGIAYFKDASVIEFSDMAVNIETGSFTKELYSFIDYSEKLENILSSYDAEVKNAWNYINNDSNYYYVDEANQGETLRFLYNLANSFINADPSGFAEEDMRDKVKDILLSMLTDENILRKIDELTGQKCYFAIKKYLFDAKGALAGKYDQDKVDAAFDELYSKADWLTEKYIIEGSVEFYDSVTSIIDNHLTSAAVEVLQFTPSKYFGDVADTALAWSDTILDALTAVQKDVYVQGVLKFESNIQYSNFVLDAILSAAQSFSPEISDAVLGIVRNFKNELNESVKEFQSHVSEIATHFTIEAGYHLAGEVVNELLTKCMGSSLMSVVKITFNLIMWLTGVNDYMKQKSVLKAYDQIGDAFLDGFARSTVTNTVNDFYCLTLLRAGCETRFDGEEVYKQFILDYIGGKNLDPVEEKEALEAINDVMGTSYSSIDAWYDVVRYNILSSKDILFNAESTESNIPSAPDVTLDYENCQTVQSFSEEYEYCFGDGVWKECDDKPIEFELDTVPQTLRVRVAASDTNLAGKITTVRIYAQKVLSNLIAVRYDGNKYLFDNLTSNRGYQMVILNSKYDTPVWEASSYVFNSYSVTSDKEAEYVAIRSTHNDELLETFSLPLVLKVQKKQPLSLTIEGDGTVIQSNASGEYFIGDTVDLIATPHESCKFIGWYINDELVSTDPHYILEFAEDLEVRAEFTGVTVESIEIATLPDKLTYTVGETLSTDGMTLNVKYSDSSTKIIDNGFICSESVLAKDGEHVITVSYGGQTTEFTVNVYREYYTLTWIVDGVKTEEQHKFGDNISYPENNPEKEGYGFVGWSVGFPQTMPAQDLTLTAVFSPVSVDVIFDANGGQFTDSSSFVAVSVDYDSKIPVPETPQKQGYIFAGWGLNGENMGTNLGVMDSIGGKTFVALWLASTDTVYTVETYTMGTDGEYAVNVQSFCGETDSVVKFEPIIETGFELDSENSILEGTVKADNPLVLKAYINRLSYTFTIDFDNGSESVSAEYYYGSIIPAPAEPEKYGYDFIGWTPDFPDTMPAENLTVSANFEAKICNAVFIDGEEEFVVTEVTFGENIPVPGSFPEKEGYTFMGWSYDGTVVLDSLGTMDEIGKTFYAVWHANEPDHVHAPQAITVPASCTVDGVEYVICLECGETIGDAIVLPANGHNPGEWETVVEPTATREGTKVRKCAECGETVEEAAIQKLAVIIDAETGITIEYTESNYDGVLKVVVEESFDGSAHTVINAELGFVKTSVYDITLLLDGKEIQPKGKIIIKLPLPDGYNPNRSFVYHIDSQNVRIEKMNAVYENGYFVFETDHLSYYAIVEEFNGTLEIREPSVTTISYGDAIILHADISEPLPSGATIKWEASNSNFDMSVSDDGTTCKITPKSSGDTTFTASIADANGNEVCSDTQTMTSKAGFFQKIIAFFKKLFGLTKTFPQAFKSIF